jgi:hypothetical protein
MDMGSVRLVPTDQVAPGDVGFDRGRSTYGRLVERATREEVAHCFVYHRRLGTTADGRARWLIAEMSARVGARFTERVEPPVAVVRVWRLPSEQQRLLDHSRDLIRSGAAYDWVEIGRILLALKSGRELSARQTERSICVAHAHRSILAGRPDLAGDLPALGAVMSPGRILDRLTALTEVRQGPTLLASRHRPRLAAWLGTEEQTA